MQIIPISQIGAQTLNVMLNNQVFQLRIMDKGSAGIFMDVKNGTKNIALGVLCLDRRRLINYPYRGFPGDLMFADQKGFTNPSFKGFNDRYVLYWLEPGEESIGL